jgi:serine/threonine protein kinase
VLGVVAHCSADTMTPTMSLGLQCIDLAHKRTPSEIALFTTRHSGTLRGYIESLSQRSSRFTPKEAASIASQIASGLSFLHSHSLLHRDLKVHAEAANHMISVVGVPHAD